MPLTSDEIAESDAYRAQQDATRVPNIRRQARLLMAQGLHPMAAMDRATAEAGASPVDTADFVPRDDAGATDLLLTRPAMGVAKTAAGFGELAYEASPVGAVSRAAGLDNPMSDVRQTIDETDALTRPAGTGFGYDVAGAVTESLPGMFAGGGVAKAAGLGGRAALAAATAVPAAADLGMNIRSGQADGLSAPMAVGAAGAQVVSDTLIGAIGGKALERVVGSLGVQALTVPGARDAVQGAVQRTVAARLAQGIPAGAIAEAAEETAQTAAEIAIQQITGQNTGTADDRLRQLAVSAGAGAAAGVPGGALESMHQIQADRGADVAQVAGVAATADAQTAVRQDAEREAAAREMPQVALEPEAPVDAELARRSLEFEQRQAEAQRVAAEQDQARQSLADEESRATRLLDVLTNPDTQPVAEAPAPAPAESPDTQAAVDLAREEMVAARAGTDLARKEDSMRSFQDARRAHDRATTQAAQVAAVRADEERQHLRGFNAPGPVEAPAASVAPATREVPASRLTAAELVDLPSADIVRKLKQEPDQNRRTQLMREVAEFKRSRSPGAVPVSTPEAPATPPAPKGKAAPAPVVAEARPAAEQDTLHEQFVRQARLAVTGSKVERDAEGRSIWKLPDGTTLARAEAVGDLGPTRPDAWFDSIGKDGPEALHRAFDAAGEARIKVGKEGDAKQTWLRFARTHAGAAKRVMAQLPATAATSRDAVTHGALMRFVTPALSKASDLGRTVDEEQNHAVVRHLVPEADKQALSQDVPALRGVDPTSVDFLEKTYATYASWRRGKELSLTPRVKNIFQRLLDKIRALLPVTKNFPLTGTARAEGVFEKLRSGDYKTMQTAPVSAGADEANATLNAPDGGSLDKDALEREWSKANGNGTPPNRRKEWRELQQRAASEELKRSMTPGPDGLSPAARAYVDGLTPETREALGESLDYLKQNPDPAGDKANLQSVVAAIESKREKPAYATAEPEKEERAAHVLKGLRGQQEPAERETHAQWEAEARAALDADPKLADRLVDQAMRKEPGSASKIEQKALFQHFADTLDDMVQKGTTPGRLNELMKIATADHRLGSEAGRNLASRGHLATPEGRRLTLAQQLFTPSDYFQRKIRDAHEVGDRKAVTKWEKRAEERIAATLEHFRAKYGLDLLDPSVMGTFTDSAYATNSLMEEINVRKGDIELADIVSTLWRQSLLSFPTTHAINAAGNIVNFTKLAALRGFAHPEQVRGLAAGAALGLGHALRNGISAFAAGRDAWSEEREGRAAPKDISASSALGRSNLNPLSYFSTKPISGVDAFFKSWAAHSFAAAHAVAAGEKISDVLADPLAHADVWAKAMADARHVTFQSLRDRLDGKDAGWIAKATDAVGRAANAKAGNDLRISLGDRDLVANIAPLVFILPFVSTPTEILRQGARMLPPVQIARMLGRAWGGEYASKTGEKRQRIGEDVGTLVAGAALAAVAAGLVGADDKDDLVTGYDADFKKVNEGRAPAAYSVKIGGKWVSYKWAAPLAAPLAQMVDVYKTLRDHPKAKPGEAAFNGLSAALKPVLGESLLEPLAELFKIVTETAQGGKGNAAEKFAVRTVGSMVPALWRKSRDLYQDAKTGTARQRTSDFADADTGERLAQQAGFEDGPTRIDLFGREVPSIPATTATDIGMRLMGLAAPQGAPTRYDLMVARYNRQNEPATPASLGNWPESLKGENMPEEMEMQFRREAGARLLQRLDSLTSLNTETPTAADIALAKSTVSAVASETAKSMLARKDGKDTSARDAVTAWRDAHWSQLSDDRADKETRTRLEQRSADLNEALNAIEKHGADSRKGLMAKRLLDRALARPVR